MRVISDYSGMKATEFSLQEIYGILTNEYFITNEEVKDTTWIQHIIAWLPLIESILVVRTMRDDYLDILFVNGNKIRIYNTGLEYAFDMLVDD